MGLALDRLSPQQLDRFLHIQSIVDRQRQKALKIRALRAYYDGEHPVMLTQRQQEFLGPLLTGNSTSQVSSAYQRALQETAQYATNDVNFAFAHNLVKAIVDTLRERLNLTGITVNGAEMSKPGSEADPNGDLAALLWSWWTENRMDGQQARLYRRAIRDGLAYVLVDYDNDEQRPRFSLHAQDDGQCGIVVHRDPSDENCVLFVNRYFYTFDPLTPGATGLERKTTYLPGEIRKYIRDTSMENGWRPYMDDGDTAWPLPWVDRQGKPLGITIIEFANPGGSEIEQVIGLQNALNKSWLDLIAAADTSGFPILAIEYKNGNQIPVEDDDDLSGTDEFRIAPGRALEVDDATIHRIEGANLAGMLETIWAIVAAISGVSRTPQYYLRPQGGADVPSGESLKQLESGLIARAEERQLLFGQAWCDVFEMALKVAQTFGSAPIGDEPSLAPVWASAATRNGIADAQEAQFHKALGIPDDFVWQKLGYTPEQIATFKQMAQAARAADVAAIASSIQLQQQRAQTAQGGQNGGTNQVTTGR